MESEVHAVFEEGLAISRLARRESVEEGEPVRPQCFDDYPGQEKAVENLKVYTTAARMRGRMLDHCLFYGPPGLGKTTLAGIVANALGCELKATSGPVLERASDLMGVLASLEPNTVLFIDEIHRLASNVEEILYPAMDDQRLDVLLGQGPSARTVKLDLPPFALIGATTRPGALSAPLLTRFGIVEHLEYYSPEALQMILMRSARIAEVAIEADAAMALARRSRGTPRIANMLLRRVTDFALVGGKAGVDCEVVDTALVRLGIDHQGLQRMDRDMLRMIRDRYGGGPVGLEAVAAALNDERSTLEEVHEPYLVYRGLVSRSPRGRVLSSEGKAHLDAVERRFGSAF